MHCNRKDSEIAAKVKNVKKKEPEFWQNLKRKIKPEDATSPKMAYLQMLKNFAKKLNNLIYN